MDLTAVTQNLAMTFYFEFGFDIYIIIMMAANHYYNDQLSVAIIKLLLGRFFRPEQINTARLNQVIKHSSVLF